MEPRNDGKCTLKARLIGEGGDSISKVVCDVAGGVVRFLVFQFLDPFMDGL